MNKKTDLSKARFFDKDEIKKRMQEAPEAIRNSTTAQQSPTVATSAKTSPPLSNLTISQSIYGVKKNNNNQETEIEKLFKIIKENYPNLYNT